MPVWHSAKLALRERYNKLGEFNEDSIDLDSRAGLRTSERFKAGAIFQLYRFAVILPVRRSRPTMSIRSSARARWPNTTDATRGRDPSEGWWNYTDALWRTGTGGYATLDIDVRRYQRLSSGTASLRRHW